MGALSQDGGEEVWGLCGLSQFVPCRLLVPLPPGPACDSILTPKCPIWRRWWPLRLLPRRLLEAVI